MNNISISFFNNSYKLLSLGVKLVDIKNENEIIEESNFKNKNFLLAFLKKHLLILEKYQTQKKNKKIFFTTQEPIKSYKMNFFLKYIKQNMLLNFNVYDYLNRYEIDNSISGAVKIQYKKLNLLQSNSFINLFVTFHNINFNLFFNIFCLYGFFLIFVKLKYSLILFCLFIMYLILTFFKLKTFVLSTLSNLFEKFINKNKNNNFYNNSYIGFYFNIHYFNKIFYFFNEANVSIDWHTVKNNKFISYIFNLEHNTIANIKNIEGKKKNSMMKISLSFLSLSMINHFVKMGQNLNLSQLDIPFFTIVGIQRNFFFKNSVSDYKSLLFVYYIEDIKNIKNINIKNLKNLSTETFINYLSNCFLLGFNVSYKKFYISFVWYQNLTIDFFFNNGFNSFSPFQLKHRIINNYLYKSQNTQKNLF